MGSLAADERFPTTHWSVVSQAACGEAEARAATGRLINLYLPALRAHLVRDLRVPADQAEDLLQDFVLSQLLQRKTLEKADRTRGRFRTFLLTCLDRYVWRELTRDRSRRQTLFRLHSLRPRPRPSPRCAFERAWAEQVLQEAMRRMEAECQRTGRSDLWVLFHGRVIAPALHGTPPLDYDQIRREFGFDSLSQATNALATAKRMFTRMLRAVVAEYVSLEQVDEELIDLKAILAAPAQGPL